MTGAKLPGASGAPAELAAPGRRARGRLAGRNRRAERISGDAQAERFAYPAARKHDLAGEDLFQPRVAGQRVAGAVGAIHALLVGDDGNAAVRAALVESAAQHQLERGFLELRLNRGPLGGAALRITEEVPLGHLSPCADRNRRRRGQGHRGGRRKFDPAQYQPQQANCLPGAQRQCRCEHQARRPGRMAQGTGQGQRVEQGKVRVGGKPTHCSKPTRR